MPASATRPNAPKKCRIYRGGRCTELTVVTVSEVDRRRMLFGRARFAPFEGIAPEACGDGSPEDGPKDTLPGGFSRTLNS